MHIKLQLVIYFFVGRQPCVILTLDNFILNFKIFSGFLGTLFFTP